MKKRNEIDFFAKEYQIEIEQSTTNIGIVDGNSSPAFTTSEEPEKWNAVINNPTGKTFQFVPMITTLRLIVVMGKKKALVTECFYARARGF